MAIFGVNPSPTPANPRGELSKSPGRAGPTAPGTERFPTVASCDGPSHSDHRRRSIRHGASVDKYDAGGKSSLDAGGGVAECGVPLADCGGLESQGLPPQRLSAFVLRRPRGQDHCRIPYVPVLGRHHERGLGPTEHQQAERELQVPLDRERLHRRHGRTDPGDGEQGSSTSRCLTLETMFTASFDEIP
jgi:hypothetical protein